ncbi:cobalamin biosynthesis protein, partial [Marivita sp.]|uniref:cobalamin biosynthesis protein n=1 Tax=Marivita sp. TaxID=2003365 RepID=UPI003F4ADEA8
MGPRRCRHFRRAAMILALGMALDALIGEPRWLWSRLPHPAVLMGRAVAALDKQFNQGEFRKAKGVFALAVLVLAAIGTGLGLRAIPGPYAEIVVLGILLAQRSLATHVGEVGQALNRSVAEGRLAV